MSDLSSSQSLTPADEQPMSELDKELEADKRRTLEGYEWVTAPATPSSPETEITEALDGLQEAIAHRTLTALRGAVPDALYTQNAVDAARAALISLYNRQREELDENYVVLDRAGKTIASLSSQIERLTGENERLRGEQDWCEQSAIITDLERTIERLKAELLTPEEAKHVYTAHVLASCVICDTVRPKLLAALRLRSLLDQKNET